MKYESYDYLAKQLATGSVGLGFCTVADIIQVVRRSPYLPSNVEVYYTTADDGIHLQKKRT